MDIRNQDRPEVNGFFGVIPPWMALAVKKYRVAWFQDSSLNIDIGIVVASKCASRLPQLNRGQINAGMLQENDSLHALACARHPCNSFMRVRRMTGAQAPHIARRFIKP